jgi:hypothetical protein
MNDKTRAAADTEMQEKKVRLLDWEGVGFVLPRIADAPGEPTCLEWVIGVTLANAIAVANAPFCAGEKDELAELSIRRVVEVIAERIDGGMLDDTIFILREVLRHCVARGDGSFFDPEPEQGL